MRRHLFANRRNLLRTGQTVIASVGVSHCVLAELGKYERKERTGIGTELLLNARTAGRWNCSLAPLLLNPMPRGIAMNAFERILEGIGAVEVVLVMRFVFVAAWYQIGRAHV